MSLRGPVITLTKRGRRPSCDGCVTDCVTDYVTDCVTDCVTDYVTDCVTDWVSKVNLKLTPDAH